MSNITNWDDIIKKEALGINDYDLGEVHEVEPEIVVTKKGVVDKDKFYLPKSLVERFDGDKVWFFNNQGRRWELQEGLTSILLSANTSLFYSSLDVIL